MASNKKPTTDKEKRAIQDRLKRALDIIRKGGTPPTPKKDNNNASLGYAGRYLQSK